MSAPEWVRWIFATVMTAVALYHLCRLAVLRRGVAAGLTHGAAGAVMTVMLLGALTRADGRTFAVVFATLGLGFAVRTVYEYVMDGVGAATASAQVAVGCCAMVYMLAVEASAGSGTMPGMRATATGRAAAAQTSALTWLIALAVVLAAWSALPRRRGGGVGAPTATAGCQMAMSATTLFMLLAM